jgi:hypothetical protein
LAASDRGRGASDASADALVFDQRRQGRWDDQFRWEALATRVKTPSQPAPGETILVRIVLDTFWKSEAAGAREKQLTLETYQLWQEPPRSAP